MKPIAAGSNVLRSPIFRQLTDEQLQEIHYASLEILERTGVRLYFQEAIDMLKKAGAYVTDGNRVRIPSNLSEWALKTVPERVALCDRQGKRTIFLEGNRSYFGTGSDCLYVYDRKSGEHRQATLIDIFEGMQVCEALPNIDFVMCMFLPSDVPGQIVDRYEMMAMLSFTRKPIVFVAPEFEGCVDCVEMATVVAGSEEELRRNPFIALYINVATDLVHNEESLRKLLYMAEKGLPTTYTPGPCRGANTPVTRAATLALSGAGQLVGLILSQLKREGTPFIWGSWGYPLDMRTQVAVCGLPDMRGFNAAQANYYGIPYFGMSGVTDSKVLDGQATAEAALTLIVDALSGANLIHDLGYMQSGLTGSLELLVICDEIIEWIRRFMEGMEINEETLALDVIDEVGPDGQFLDHDHTLRHFKEDWYPKLMDRRNYEDWIASGGKTLQQRAREKVEEILGQPKPQVLRPEIQGKIRDILERVESKIK